MWQPEWQFGGEMDTCICIAESLCCVPETITTLIIAKPQYKIKSKKKIGLEICPITLFGNMQLKLWCVCTDRMTNRKQKAQYTPSPAYKNRDLKFEK